MSSYYRLATASAVLALLLACNSSDPVSPNLRSAASIAPACQLGCIDPDPDPAPDTLPSPGYWLGGGIDNVQCFDGSQTDSDGDGLSEFCERNLAAAFAPELYYWQYDEVGRETKWVARPLSGTKVRIGYLLSYYRDAGSTSFGCTLPGAPSSCFGHNGDSEHIFLDVVYNPETFHWVLSKAYYSQHESVRVFSYGKCTWVGESGCISLQFPDADGGYPRAYVAEGKHANYASRTECENGGFGGSDTCYQVNTAARVAAGSAATNLGSRAVHTSSQDCTPSTNSNYVYYGAGRIECYWTPRAFRGWIPDYVGGAGSGNYPDILASMGF